MTLGAFAITLLIGLHAPPGAAAEPAGSLRWTPQAPLQLGRAGLGVVTVNGTILAIGGFNPPEIFANVEARRLTGGGPWQPAVPLPTARVNLGTAVLNGRVYAVGGYGASGDPLTVVETFDPTSGRWAPSLPLPEPRGGIGAAALNGRLYVAGGVVPVGGGEFRSTASMVVFDPVRNTWRPAAPMHIARERFRLVAVGGFLSAVGGRGEGPSLATAERYDPRTDSWREINSMNESRVVPCVVESRIGDRPVLVAVGGAVFGDAGTVVDGRRTTEVLDLATGRWTLLEVLLPTNRISLDCAVQPDRTILAISGSTFTGNGFAILPNVDALTLP
jgi:hypothetical protein